jgi:hypothetical protein
MARRGMGDAVRADCIAPGVAMLYGDPLKSFVNLASFCQIPAFIGLYSYSLARARAA